MTGDLNKKNDKPNYRKTIKGEGKMIFRGGLSLSEQLRDLASEAEELERELDDANEEFKKLESKIKELEEE